MRKHFLFLALTVAPTAVLAQPAAPPLERPPAYDRLDLLIGTWTTADLPADMSFRETCQWVARRRHVVCHARRESPRGVGESMSILTYIEADSTYRHYDFGARGDPSTLTGRPHGDGFVFTGESGAGETLTRVRVTLTPSAEGFLFVAEEATGDGPFSEVAREIYLRVE